jgi:hypothetical protein
MDKINNLVGLQYVLQDIHVQAQVIVSMVVEEHTIVLALP